MSKWATQQPDPTKTFKSTVVFGAVDGDTMPELDPWAGQDTGDVDLQVWTEAVRTHIKKTVPVRQNASPVDGFCHSKDNKAAR